jgi:hypothetical protein
MARKTGPDGHKLSSKACPQKFSASLAQNRSSNGRQKAKERIGDGSKLTRIIIEPWQLVNSLEVIRVC